MQTATNIEIVAVVLAAGAARRFGRPKQLERWPAVTGPTLVERALANALACAATEIIVVTGNAASEVAAVCATWAAANLSATGLNQMCQVVYNLRWAEGQGFSVAAGVQAIEPGSRAALFFLADQPRLAPTTGTALITAFKADPDERAIIFPTFAGKRGNPVLFGCAHFAALARLEGDVGGRAVVKAHPDCVREIAVADPAIHEDVDTPQDLTRLDT